MKKAKNYFLVIWAICLALFNVIVFVVPNDNREADNFWIGYILITLSLVGNLVCSFVALNTKSNAKAFYNIPLISISVVGVVVASVIGSIVMVVPGIKTWVGVVAAFVVLAVVAIASLTAKSAADVVESIDEKIKIQTSFVKELTLDAELLMSSAKTPEIKENVKKVYEALRYSDPMSSEKLANEEQRIKQQFELLSEVVLNEDVQRAETMSADLINLIEYRNKKCKLVK